MTIKIKVGTFTLTEARDQNLPQGFAAWHQTVRITPGAYDVFAYLEPEGPGSYRIHSLSASCEGITVSSSFRSHVLGSWGKSDNNRNGQPATAHIDLPTYGVVDQGTSILDQAALCDALVRTEWTPQDVGQGSAIRRMWLFTWNEERRPIIIEQPRYGGGVCVAAFEDQRRFRVGATEVSPRELAALSLSFQHLSSADQFTVGETAAGWSRHDKLSHQVTRIA